MALVTKQIEFGSSIKIINRRNLKKKKKLTRLLKSMADNATLCGRRVRNIVLSIYFWLIKKIQTGLKNFKFFSWKI